MNEKENKIKDNIIIGNIKVKKDNISLRIINSYENVKSEYGEHYKGIKNENEIKENKYIFFY